MRNPARDGLLPLHNAVVQVVELAESPRREDTHDDFVCPVAVEIIHHHLRVDDGG